MNICMRTYTHAFEDCAVINASKRHWALSNQLIENVNKLRVDGGEVGGWVKWVMSIKDGTYCHEQWVLYVSDESPNSTPETNITVHVN